MARIVTVGFKVPSPADYVEEGEVVTTLSGVYWQVQARDVVEDEVRLQLWPIDGHAADKLNGRAPRELPMRMAREVLPDEQFGPNGAPAG